MFIHVKPKTLVQSVRFVLFSILDSLVAKHRDGMHTTAWISLYLPVSVLKSMGKEFLDGYVSLADGEKDPRNLIVAFAIARVILIEFDIYERIEVIFCTFPLILTNGFSRHSSTSSFVTSLLPSVRRLMIHMGLPQKIFAKRFGTFHQKCCVSVA